MLHTHSCLWLVCPEGNEDPALQIHPLLSSSVFCEGSGPRLSTEILAASGASAQPGSEGQGDFQHQVLLQSQGQSGPWGGATSAAAAPRCYSVVLVLDSSPATPTVLSGWLRIKWAGTRHFLIICPQCYVFRRGGMSAQNSWLPRIPANVTWPSQYSQHMPFKGGHFLFSLA